MTCSILYIEIPLVAPVRSPAVLYNPGAVSSACIVVPTHYNYSMVRRIARVGFVTTTGVVVKVVHDGHRCGYRSVQQCLLYRSDGVRHGLIVGDSRYDLALILCARQVVSGLIGYARFTHRAGSFEYRIGRAEPSSVAAGAPGVTVDNLLLREVFDSPVVYMNVAFELSDSGECPARAAPCLIFDGCRSAVRAPIEVGVEGYVASRLEDRKALVPFQRGRDEAEQLLFLFGRKPRNRCLARNPMVAFLLDPFVQFLYLLVLAFVCEG